jgi:hypothetical protein
VSADVVIVFHVPGRPGQRLHDAARAAGMDPDRLAAEAMRSRELEQRARGVELFSFLEGQRVAAEEAAA